jgi:ferredoxin
MYGSVDQGRCVAADTCWVVASEIFELRDPDGPMVHCKNDLLQNSTQLSVRQPTSVLPLPPSRQQIQTRASRTMMANNATPDLSQRTGSDAARDVGQHGDRLAPCSLIPGVAVLCVAPEYPHETSVGVLISEAPHQTPPARHPSCHNGADHPTRCACRRLSRATVAVNWVSGRPTLYKEMVVDHVRC